MSDKCYSCWNNFSLFNKQIGCKSCGFAFCKRCLTKKAIVSKSKDKDKDEKHFVCNKCYDIITGVAPPPAYASINVEPPAVLAKRLAQCEEKAERRKNHLVQLNKKKEEESKDDEIANRLSKLKDSRAGAKEMDSKVAPTVEEIEQRLHSLKELKKEPGQSCSVQAPKTLKKDEVESLLEEISDEIFLEKSFLADESAITTSEHLLQPGSSNADDLIKRTVEEVKEEVENKTREDEKDASLLKRLEEIKKFTAGETFHNKLHQNNGDEETAKSSDALQELRKKWENEEEESSKEELLWCCMCDKDTMYQCLECDGDLFCQQCFKRYHARLSGERHELTLWKKL